MKPALQREADQDRSNASSMTELTARDIMTSPVLTVPAELSVQEVAQRLSQERVSGMIVVDQQGQAVGMVTESDLIQRVAHPHLPPQVNILGSIFFLDSPAHMDEMMRKMMGTRAQDIMSAKLVTAQADTPVQDLADRMLEHKIGRIPILEAGRPVGIVTRHDLVRRVIATGQVS